MSLHPPVPGPVGEPELEETLRLFWEMLEADRDSDRFYLLYDEVDRRIARHLQSGAAAQVAPGERGCLHRGRAMPA